MRNAYYVPLKTDKYYIFSIMLYLFWLCTRWYTIHCTRYYRCFIICYAEESSSIDVKWHGWWLHLKWHFESPSIWLWLQVYGAGEALSAFGEGFLSLATLVSIAVSELRGQGCDWEDSESSHSPSPLVHAVVSRSRCVWKRLHSAYDLVLWMNRFPYSITCV